MADDLEDDELEGQPDARQFDAGAQPRIARPNPPASSLPPVTLRGIGAATPAAQPSGTEDMEANGLASHLAPAPIAGPIATNPIETRTQHDQERLSQLERSPSGVAGLWQKAKGIQNPVLRGLGEVGAVGANVLDKAGTMAGNIYRPLRGITAAIPGTTAHHEALIGEQRGRIAEDLGEQKGQSEIGEITERALKEKEEAANQIVEARLHKAQADEVGQPRPKEEKWGEFTGYTDTDGTPLLREENSGQVVRASDKKPATGFKPAVTEKTQNPQQQAFQGYLDQGLTPQQAYEKIREKTPDAEAGTWQLGEDKDGKPILWNSKTGAQRDSGGISRPGTHEKAEQAGAGEQQAINYAKDYLDRGVFTGPGDEALQEKFFELAKPKTGFRMSQPQMEMLQNSRSWMTGIEAHVRHATTGTWFSQEQRQQIFSTMQELADARQKSTANTGPGGAGGGGQNNEPQRPANVPANYVYQKNGSKGEGWYRP